MVEILIWGLLLDLLRSPQDLRAENLALIQQLNVVRRAAPRRLRFGRVDRTFEAALEFVA